MATAFAGEWVVEPHVAGGFDMLTGIAKLTMPASSAAGATGEDVWTALSMGDHFDSVYGGKILSSTLAGGGQVTWQFYGTEASGKGVTALKLASYWSADGTDGEVFKATDATTDYEAQVGFMYVEFKGYKA